MKNPFTLKSLLMAAIVMSPSCALLAQQPGKNVQERLVNKNGTAYFLKFDKTSPYKADDYNAIFKDQLDLPEEASILKTTSKTDEMGILHEKFQLFYKGLKVEHAVYSLHSKANVVQSMVGKKYELKDFDISPAISAGEAFEKALQSVHAEKYLWEIPAEAALINYSKPEGVLLILPPLNGLKISKPHLAYKFDIYATKPMSRDEIYVDANDGSILLVDAIMKHARDTKYASQAAAGVQSFDVLLKKPAYSLPIAGNADTRYMGTSNVTTSLSGSNYILQDQTRGNGIRTWNFNRTTGPPVNFTDANNVWTAAEFNNVNKDNGALDAHYAAGKTYDYFFTKHGLNSYNGQGAAINSAVHYQNNWVNASWDGSWLRFGDGNNITYDILTSTDVVAHEFGHAVCQFNAGLMYIAESGALNESFSDIWAACIDYYAAPATMDPAAIKEWIIVESGELRPGHVGMRSLSDPALEEQPDTYQAGDYWCPNQCDPHINSGVFNHWFYVLSKGETGINDVPESYSVTGIGMTKAAKIAYHLEEYYLIADSNFEEAYAFGLEAARDLYPLPGSTEFVATVNAFHAVGLGNAYVADTTPPTAPINLTATILSNTRVDLSWIAATDNVSVTYYDIYEGNYLRESIQAPATTYVAWGLQHSTPYTFKVRARDNNGNVSPFSNTVSLTMPTTTTNYCTAYANSSATARISNVTFVGAGLNNTTVATVGYENFSQTISLHPTLTVGTTHNYQITPFYTTTPTTPSTFSIYADLNQDGDFGDANELLATQASTAALVTGSFLMPATPITGWTRIRIIMRANSIVSPTPCGTFSSGQVEDYALLVNPQSQIPGWFVTTPEVKNEQPVFGFNLYPNPADDAINVSLIGKSADKQPYSIVNYLGQTVKSGNLDTQAIEINGLSKGIYILKITDRGQSVSKKFIKR